MFAVVFTAVSLLALFAILYLWVLILDARCCFDCEFGAFVFGMFIVSGGGRSRSGI
jgi:hypothetical protein